tara:strand:+ start:75 stop:920 length:846 start_codon:yes stop_codon:yes gene_type:complete
MKIGLIGYGFVGKALVNGLNDDVIVKIIDPLLHTKVDDLKAFGPEIIFICVPTPMNSDGSQDLDILWSVIKDIKSLNLDTMVVLKSTVLPSHLDEIINQFKSFVLNPEFLKENSANEDFINPSMILFGGDQEDCNKLSNFYKKYTKCKTEDYVFVDVITASLIKYSINSFLATKVIFFNELKNIFDKSGSSDMWEDFTEILSLDNRIGKSHMQVPGPDGRKGYGGACFPKDTNALHNYSRELGLEFELLKKAIIVNNAIRSKYNDLALRESEQNINFEDKN